MMAYQISFNTPKGDFSIDNIEITSIVELKYDTTTFDEWDNKFLLSNGFVYSIDTKLYVVKSFTTSRTSFRYTKMIKIINKFIIINKLVTFLED